MERVHSQTSNIILTKKLTIKANRHTKIHDICPSEPKEDKSIEQQMSKVRVHNENVSQFTYQLNSKMKTIMYVRPIYSLQCFLKGIQIINEEIPYTVQKIRSFPSNKYRFRDSRDTNNNYQLTSNFLGSQYNLTKEGLTHLTITFDVSLGNHFRNVTIHSYNPSQMRKGIDLSQIEQIEKFFSLEPNYSSQQKTYSLPFSRKSVIPSVKNTILCNSKGQRVLQMIKINEQSLFQVSFNPIISTEKALAFVIASLDFKIFVQ